MSVISSLQKILIKIKIDTTWCVKSLDIAFPAAAAAVPGALVVVEAAGAAAVPAAVVAVCVSGRKGSASASSSDFSITWLKSTPWRLSSAFRAPIVMP